MLVPSRNVIPSWTPRCWARSSRRSHTPRWAQRMNICAARDQGPRSAGMGRHLAPFSCRQTIAEMVRRRSFGCVLPLGRHASTNGSKLIHCASDSIALSSFQEGQNARHPNRFKREHALVIDLDEGDRASAEHPALLLNIQAKAVVDELTKLRISARVGQHEPDLERSALGQGRLRKGWKERYGCCPGGALKEIQSRDAHGVAVIVAHQLPPSRS